MANFLFNDALVSIGKGEILWNSDTIKGALYTSSLTPNQDTQTYLSDLSNEASGTGYTTGGVTLGGKSVTADDTNNRAIFDANDLQWTGLSTSYRYVIVYQSTGNAATSRLIACYDYGSTQTVDNGTLDITWPTSGVFNVANTN